MEYEFRVKKERDGHAYVSIPDFLAWLLSLIEAIEEEVDKGNEKAIALERFLIILAETLLDAGGYA
jgi:hypothetical protein